MYTFDHDLFLALNFDGGKFMDTAMTVISGTAMWIPLYLFIFAAIWKRYGWKNTMEEALEFREIFEVQGI